MASCQVLLSPGDAGTAENVASNSAAVGAGCSCGGSGWWGGGSGWSGDIGELRVSADSGEFCHLNLAW